MKTITYLLFRSGFYVVFLLFFLSPLFQAYGMGQQNSKSSNQNDNFEKEEPIMISLLNDAYKMSIEDYNPVTIIEAVNALQPLGKERSLENVNTFLATCDRAESGYGLFWVLRVLFEMPSGIDFPSVRIGQPTIPPPDDVAKLPRYPLLIIGDIPLLLTTGYILGGMPEPIENHIAYYQQYGSIRKKPLKPDASTEDVMTQFHTIWKDAYGDNDNGRVLEWIRIQISRIANKK